jgi:hypothetical protein
MGINFVNLCGKCIHTKRRPFHSLYEKQESIMPSYGYNAFTLVNPKKRPRYDGVPR